MAQQGDGQVEQLGVLQSEWLQSVTGYEEFSKAWGRTLVMPMEGVYSMIKTFFNRGSTLTTPQLNECPRILSFAPDLMRF